MALFVYVDNSNLWIEGQHVQAVRAGLPPSRSDALRRRAALRWSYDFGRLHELACPANEQIGRAVLFGSRPPANDSLWSRAHADGFDVHVFERNAANKEKQVDTGLATLMVTDCYSYMRAGNKDRVVLVAGDSDFLPPVRAVQDRGIPVRVVFWRHATSRALRDLADEFVALDPHFDWLTRASRNRPNPAGRPRSQPTAVSNQRPMGSPGLVSLPIHAAGS